MYSDLASIEDVDDLLKDDSCVILYENKPRNGHWVCLVRKYDKGTIEFYDSYGLFPDKQKDHMNKRFLRDTQQTYNKIAELLWNARDRYRVEFNNHRLQKWCKDIATCGIHVVARIKLKGMTIDQYKAFLKRYKGAGMTPDDVVTIISEYH